MLSSNRNAALKTGLAQAVYALAYSGDIDAVNHLVDEFHANRYAAAEGFMDGGFKEHYDKFTLTHMTDNNDKMNPLFFIEHPYTLDEYIALIAYTATLNDNQAMARIQYDGVKKEINVKLALSEATYQLAKTGRADAALRLVYEYGANRHAAALGFAEGGHDQHLALLIANSLMHNSEIKMDVIAEGYAMSNNVTGIINLYNDNLITEEAALNHLRTHSSDTAIAEFKLAAAKRERIAAEKMAADEARNLEELKAAMATPAAESPKVSNNPATVFARSPVSSNVGNATDLLNFLKTKQP